MPKHKTQSKRKRILHNASAVQERWCFLSRWTILMLQWWDDKGVFLVHCNRIPLNTVCSKGTRFGQSAQWWQAGCWLGVNWDESRERFLVVFTTMAQFSGPVVNRSPTRGVRAAGCWDLDPKGLTRSGCVQMFLPYMMYCSAYQDLMFPRISAQRRLPQSGIGCQSRNNRSFTSRVFFLRVIFLCYGVSGSALLAKACSML
jgi:hypothetical protein